MAKGAATPTNALKVVNFAVHASLGGAVGASGRSTGDVAAFGAEGVVELSIELSSHAKEVRGRYGKS